MVLSYKSKSFLGDSVIIVQYMSWSNPTLVIDCLLATTWPSWRSADTPHLIHLCLWFKMLQDSVDPIHIATGDDAYTPLRYSSKSKLYDDHRSYEFC